MLKNIFHRCILTLNFICRMRKTPYEFHKGHSLRLPQDRKCGRYARGEQNGADLVGGNAQRLQALTKPLCAFSRIDQNRTAWRGNEKGVSRRPRVEGKDSNLIHANNPSMTKR